MAIENGAPFPIGTKVRVKDFPPATMQAAPFDWNGLVGEVRRIDKVGFGLNGKAVYAYEVFFKDVKVPFAKRNPATGKIEKGAQLTDAQNYFEAIFLDPIQ